MLARSFSSALKGKGKAVTRLNAASTPSILQAVAGPSSRAVYRTSPSAPMKKTICTCRPRYTPARATVQPAIVHKARLHATASQRQSSSKIPEVAELSMREYHEIADQTMDQLTDTLEALQEELADDDFDVEYSSGVLTVKLPKDKGTYVINKQPPNKQIWLSSPLSGPKRYDYSNDDQHWFYTRDGSFLLKLLEEELSEKLGTKVSFEA